MRPAVEGLTDSVRRATAPGFGPSAPGFGPCAAAPAPLSEAGLFGVDDATLVAMLVDRDRRAQQIAWLRFAPMVYRILRRAFAADRDVDDLAQDVFLVLLLRVHTLREPQALRAFIISITSGTIRYAIRRKTSSRVEYEAEPAVVRAVAAADVEAREALDRLVAILDRLSAADRAVFVLRYVEGRDVAAISQLLGVSLATTKRRLARVWGRVAMHARRDTALAEYLAGGARHALPEARPR